MDERLDGALDRDGVMLCLEEKFPIRAFEGDVLPKLLGLETAAGVLDLDEL